MTFQIFNSKKNFGQIGPAAVITVDGFNNLKNSVNVQWSSMTTADRDKWNTVFALITKMPVLEGWGYWKSDDCNSQSSADAYRRLPCYSIIHPQSFSGTASKNSAFPNDVGAWGIDAAVGLSPFARLIANWSAKHNVAITFSMPTLKRAAQIRKYLDSGEYTVERYDPIENLAEVNACVVFLPGQHGGYLNDKGGRGPLGGARLFQSTGAAYTTIRSQRLRSAAVVHVAAQVLKVDPESALDGDFSLLLEAVSIVERKRLKQALEQASREELMERLSLLDNPGEKKRKI